MVKPYGAVIVRAVCPFRSFADVQSREGKQTLYAQGNDY